MERIERNPYRILGVNVGAPLSAEISHLSRIRAFAKVGQEAAFHPAGDDLLPPAVRNVEAAEAAAQTLSLPRDRVAYALFWLSGYDSDWGRELDNAVGALIRTDYAEAVASYGRLVSDPSKRRGFVEAATHGLLDLSEFELSEMVISLLSQEDISISRLIQDGGALPSGEIAQRLLEIELPKLRERLFAPFMLILEEDNIYNSIDRFQTAVEDLKPVCRAIGEIFGYDSVDYKEFAEEIANKILFEGSRLIWRTGKMAWIYPAASIPGIHDRERRRANMPARYIKSCMYLIDWIDCIVEEGMEILKLDQNSFAMLYEDFENYNNIKTREYADNDEIAEYVGKFKKRRGITVGIWLAALAWFLYILI